MLMSAPVKEYVFCLEVIEFAVKFLNFDFVLFLNVLDFFLERFVRFLGVFILVQQECCRLGQTLEIFVFQASLDVASFC